MKQLLARSDESLLLSQVHDAVIVTDLDGKVRLWNSGAQRVYGYMPDEIVGQAVNRLYFPQDISLLQSAVFGPLRNKDLHEVVLRNRRKDGTEIFVELRVSVVRDRSGKLIGYAGCSNDVTIRKRAEEALAAARDCLEQRVAERSQKLLEEIAERTRIEAELRSSRERLRHILVNAPGILYSCSPIDLAATFVSDKIHGVLGYSADEFLNTADFWIGRIHPEDRPRVLAAAARIVESGTFSQEYRINHRDGSCRWFHDDATLIRNPDGDATELVGYMRDITEAKHAEEARREQERLEVVARHLVNAQESERKRISRELHDNLNQQLAALVLDVAELESVLADSPKSIQRRVHQLKTRVAGVSDDVDRMARQLHPAPLEQFGLEATLRSECASVRKRTGIRLTFRCRSFPIRVPREVELCLYRVAQECMSNFIRHAKASRGRVTLSAGSQGIRLAIEDFGVGFDHPGVARERLGLRNMAERVRLLHGTLTVDSVIGRGTRVEASIPLTEAINAETSHPAGR